MKQIHDNVLIKKTRYDLNLSVENASRFEQLCEAYDMPKSQMADFIIESFCKGNAKYTHYLKNINRQKIVLAQKAKSDLSLFGVNDDS